MKILNLAEGCTTYTSNAYLLLGEWNAVSDCNTLIDTGRDERILQNLAEAYTGVGKKRVEQIILTHNHYDHNGLLPKLRELYDLRVYALHDTHDGVVTLVKDGTMLKVADTMAEIIRCPGHSSDSLCVYFPTQKALFTGDAPVLQATRDGSYDEDFYMALIRLRRREVRAIYPGHGCPVLENCNAQIAATLADIRFLIPAGTEGSMFDKPIAGKEGTKAQGSSKYERRSAN